MESSMKITLPKMTIYEKTIVIAKRIKQLDEGAESTIENIITKEDLYNSRDIAIREYELNKLPYYEIFRNLPNGDYEKWVHNDFKYFP